MSKYTTEVRYICEQAANLSASEGYLKIPDIINRAIPVIFDFDFPVWKESERVNLERKILTHFYTREIGFETVGLWKLKLCMKLNEVMPYFNGLYAAVESITNPMWDTDLHHHEDNQYDADQTINSTSSEDQTHSNNDTQTRKDKIDHNDQMTRNLSDTETGTVDTDRTIDTTDRPDNWRKINDTPQGGIVGLAADNYITSAEHNSGNDVQNVVDTTNEDRDLTFDHTGTETTTGVQNVNGSLTTNTSFTGHKQGKDDQVLDRTDKDKLQHYTWGRQGTPIGSLFDDYRKNLVAVDTLLMEELNDLFMLIY